ncbi:MAG TPA: S49 family peptidase, partial [Actinomycetota bacterium]|nr:S49 family peptidase [Actinomycetota bacterium]
AATMLVADLAEELRSAGVDRGALTAARTTLLSALEEDRAGDSHVATERRYDRIAAYIGQTVWAIHPAWLATILGIVGERRSGHRPTAGEIRRRIAGRERRAAAVDESGGIAVIPIVGPIVPKAAMVDDISGDGGTSMEGLLAAFRAAMGSNDVSAIVFDVDSPGGSVDLVPEAASEIMAARGTKPIVAVADTIAASAAYWLASAADELVVTPSGQVGSIGVYSAHEDISVWLENEGLKETLISAGEYKVEANPFEPLAEEAAAEIQRHVNAFYAMFLAAVASQRGVSVDAVSADFGQGRMVLATDAVTRGMADSVATLDQVLARLGRTAPPDPGERDTGNTMDLDMAQREIELLKLTR